MGCHSIAVGRYLLTPAENDPLFLQPVSVQANLALLKWGQPKYREQLKERFGLDYRKTPAEDFASGSIRNRNPQTGQETIRLVMAAYMAHERGRIVDLTDPKVNEELENYIPLIQQGKGAELLY
jgi:hypothetical protein